MMFLACAADSAEATCWHSSTASVLGSGHYASVLRVAAIATTMALVERFSSVELMEPIDWQGGSGFISPIALPVLPSL